MPSRTARILTDMKITIQRYCGKSRWETVACADTWTIADAIGNMLAANGDQVRAFGGKTVIEYTKDDAA